MWYFSFFAVRLHLAEVYDRKLTLYQDIYWETKYSGQQKYREVN